MPQHARNRTGVTLVELLVVMSILVALTALALMILPTFTNNTASLAGTAEVQSTLRNAQSMAASTRLPRGVRLIPTVNQSVGGVPNPPPNNFPTICTEMQYLEVPPMTIITTAQVQFVYLLEDGKQGSGQPVGTVLSRHCIITGLNADQQAQVTVGATLVLPALGYWSRINKLLPNNEVALDVYPDTSLGAASPPPPNNPGVIYQTTTFGISGPPVPLLGEPTVVLPKNIGIDLWVSSPACGSTGQYYDIVFAPNGQTISTYGTPQLSANTGIYLWVRDYTKSDMVPNNQSPWAFDPNKFLRGGEQYIVGIRNGYVGTAPVIWPDNSSGPGTYSSPYGPFASAKMKLN